MPQEHNTWNQEAHRHSAVVDPVVTIQELGRFTTLRSIRSDYAVVLTTRRGNHDVYLPPRRPTRAEITARRWTTAYEIDMGVHEDSGSLEILSQEDAFPFQVTVRSTWQVRDPAAFVASGERDVPGMIRRTVERVAQPLLRQCSTEWSAEAELKLVQALHEAHPALGRAEGLEVQWWLAVRRDEGARAQERDLRAIRFARQRLVPAHELDLEADRNAAARVLADNTQRHEVELHSQRLAHERELARVRQEIELQQIEAQKISFYTYYLSQHGPEAMAFQLSRHPEDTRLVMENLREDQLTLMKGKLDLAMQALSGGPGGLEEHQMDVPRKWAAQHVSDLLAPPGTSASGTGPGGTHAHGLTSSTKSTDSSAAAAAAGRSKPESPVPDPRAQRPLATSEDHDHDPTGSHLIGYHGAAPRPGASSDSPNRRRPS